MAEQPVFWLGGKPGDKKKSEQGPEAERYEAALRDACAECGYDVDEYVAALGNFGGWLMHMEREGVPYRLFWNGRAKQLVLEENRERGGWSSVRSAETADEGLPGFVQAVQGLLNDGPAPG